MSKYSFLILLLIGLIDASLSISCNANSCGTVGCKTVADDCGPGHLRGKGRYCGCCDVCRKIIGEGEDCSSGISYGGVTSDNVVCDKNKDLICTQGVCRKDES